MMAALGNASKPNLLQIPAPGWFEQAPCLQAMQQLSLPSFQAMHLDCCGDAVARALLHILNKLQMMASCRFHGDDAAAGP